MISYLFTPVNILPLVSSDISAALSFSDMPSLFGKTPFCFFPQQQHASYPHACVILHLHVCL